MSSTHTYEKELEIGGYEYAVSVEATYTPGYKGAFEGGQQVEPDEEEDVEINEVLIKDGNGDWKELPWLEQVESDLSDWWLEEHKSRSEL